MTVGGTRSTDPVDCPKTESKALWPVDRSGRPCPVPGQRAQVCARRSVESGRPTLEHGRPSRSTQTNREQTSLLRSTGPVDRPLCQQRAQVCARRSTGPVDRRAQTCARCWHSGRSTRPVDRKREQCSLFVWVDRAGRPGLPNGHISDRWRSIGPVDRQPVRLPHQPNG